jgi:outer membrane lipoprotein-sorting protein
MHSGRKLNLAASMYLVALIAVAMLPGRVVFAADDVQPILHQLDDAAVKFRSTSADFEFDSVMTDPVPDTDVQKGTVYYERTGNDFQMAAHIKEVNGKPVPKIYSYSSGRVRLYEPMVNQVTTLSKAGDYGSYLMLGFGASGKALAEKWDIKSLGQETIDGVKTEKLELTAKDPNVRKNLPKVTIWMDTSRGVSLRQVFDEGQGQHRDCHYFNFKMNQPLPGDAFTVKTDSKTVYVNR